MNAHFETDRVITTAKEQAFIAFAMPILLTSVALALSSNQWPYIIGTKIFYRSQTTL